MARQLQELLAEVREWLREIERGRCSKQTEWLFELCDAAEQTDRWLVDAHVRHAQEQDEASAERAALVRDRDAVLLADHDSESCPSWIDGCHCTVETLRHNIMRAEIAEAAHALEVSNIQSLMLLFEKRDAATFAAHESFRSLWNAFGDTVKQRDAAVLALREIQSKSSDASARVLAKHALKLAQFDPTDHQGTT